MEAHKVFLHIEFKGFGVGGAFSSYRNQVKMLAHLGIPTTEQWDKDATIFQTNSPWLGALYYALRAKRRGMAVIIWGHTTAEDIAGFFRLRLMEKLATSVLRPYFHLLYGLADIVLCPTPYTRRTLLAYGLSPEKLVVQSNGVDVSRFYASPDMREAARTAFGLTRLAVGNAAIVIPRKGIRTFVAVARQLPDLQFAWFGKIFNRALVAPIPRDLPENIRFMGFAPDIVLAFNALDIFLFPSLEENQGMAILEAAAVGLPIIVRDLPVYEGWLKHGHNCLKAKTEEEFAIHVESLSHDPAMRAHLGGNARLTAVEEGLLPLAERLLEIYGRVAATRFARNASTEASHV